MGVMCAMKNEKIFSLSKVQFQRSKLKLKMSIFLTICTEISEILVRQVGGTFTPGFYHSKKNSPRK